MKKDLIIILIIIAVLAFFISGAKIQSVDDYYLTNLEAVTEDSETVFLSIECSAVFDNWNDLDINLRDEKYVPANGIILPETEYVLRKGDTVFNILDRAIRHNKIHMACEYSYQKSSVYVKGINQLFEFSCGPLSGWVFYVNGVFANYGSSAYKLKNGDVIEWKFTCDLGAAVRLGERVQPFRMQVLCLPVKK